MIDWSKKKEIDYEFPYKATRYLKQKIYLLPQAVFMALPRPITIKKSEDDTYFMVTEKYENRLDLIAHEKYSQSKLWWVIALANDLPDAQHVPKGSVLRIPSQGTIFGAGGVLGK